MKVFNCYACEKEFPVIFGHEHHRIPQAAGGTDKDIVWLCAGDHSYAHSLAYIIMNPKRSRELDASLEHFGNEDYKYRILELANTVAVEMQAKAEGFKTDSIIVKKVILTLTEEEHLRYLTMARDRKLSIVNFFIALARRESEREL